MDDAIRWCLERMGAQELFIEKIPLNCLILLRGTYLLQVIEDFLNTAGAHTPGATVDRYEELKSVQALIYGWDFWATEEDYLAHANKTCPKCCKKVSNGT